MFQYIAVGISVSLAIVGIVIALWGAQLEVITSASNPTRGLPMIVIGTLITTLAGLLVTIAGKLLR